MRYGLSLKRIFLILQLQLPDGEFMESGLAGAVSEQRRVHAHAADLTPGDIRKMRDVKGGRQLGPLLPIRADPQADHLMADGQL